MNSNYPENVRLFQRDVELLRNYKISNENKFSLETFDSNTNEEKAAFQRIEAIKEKMKFSLEMLQDSLEELTDFGIETQLKELDIIGETYNRLYNEYDVEWAKFSFYENEMDEDGTTIHISDATAFELAQIISKLIDANEYDHHFSNDLFKLYTTAISELEETDAIIIVIEYKVKGMTMFRASSNGNNFDKSIAKTLEGCFSNVLHELFPELNSILFPNGAHKITHFLATLQKLRELGYNVRYVNNNQEKLDVIHIFN